MGSLQKVVIAGGGFAGLNAALGLRKAPVDLTVIDRRNYHLFQPLLYQVATGSLSPADIAAPLRSVLHKQKNTRVVLGEVLDFDTGGHRVLMDTGTIEYDTLVLAVGVGNHYFGNSHWIPYAPGLKTVEDATGIRSRIFSAFEKAEMETDPAERKALLRFVIVGAGPTGVELAGAIGEIARDTLRGDFRNIRTEESEILLLEGAATVLPPFDSALREHAERALIGLGVRCRLGVKVTGIDARGVEIETGQGPQRIESRTVLWAAGVRPSPLAKLLAEKLGAKADPSGRILVNESLSIPGHEEIFVVGDIAHFVQDGKPLPGMAPVAMQQGRYVARAIRDRIAGKAPRPFHFRDKGTMATIGRHAAVGEIGKLRFHGILAWLAWLFIHLMYIVGHRNRLLVFIQWAFQYFTFNRGARLITGSARMNEPP